MKKFLLLGFIIALLINCQQTTDTGNVGEKLTLTADIPDDNSKYDYVWKIFNLPESSNLVLSDMQFSADESRAFFVPDVPGQYSIQVTVWRYNDKLGSHIYNYNITEEKLASATPKPSKDAWLDEDVDTPTEIQKSVSDTITKVVEATIPERSDEKVIPPTPEPSQPIKEIVEKPISTTEKTTDPYLPSIAPPTTATAKYTIQIIATSNLNKARNLENKLSNDGYDAYFIDKSTASKKLYKVRIGKYSNRKEAARAARSIEANYGLSTWVTKYKQIPSVPLTKKILTQYTIQITATPYLNKAMNLENKLSNDGYDAYYIDQSTTSKKLYKVRIGKYSTRKEAVRAARSIEANYGLSTWVTKY